MATIKQEYKSALAAFIIASLILYMSVEVPLLALAAPFVLVYAVARGGYAAGGAAAVLSFIAPAIFDLNFALILAAAFLPAAFAAGFAIRSKMRFLYAVLLSSGGLLLGAALVLAAPTVFYGMSAVDYIVNGTVNTMKALDDKSVSYIYYFTRYYDIMTGAVTQQAVESTSAADAIANMQVILRDSLNLGLVSMLGTYSLMGGYLCYTVPRAYAKRQGGEVAPIPAFSDYSLPKRMWLAFGLTYIFASIGASNGWRSFDAVQLAVFNVYALLFAAQALCLLDFMYRQRGMRKGIRTMLHILAAFVLGAFLMWLGIFENLLNLRKRMNERQA